jgi:hypothetical protein
LESCPKCQHLEAIRLAKIKHWVALIDQRDSAERESKTLPPDFYAAIPKAEEAITEAWARIGEHRKSHDQTPPSIG